MLVRFRLALVAVCLAVGVTAEAQPLDLGTLGGTFSHATAVNNRGVVVGRSRLADDLTYHAFRWHAGQLEDLGTLPRGTHSAAEGINNGGEIVGWADVTDDFDVTTTRAVRWQPGQPAEELGRLPGSEGQHCRAMAISDAGHIVGSCDMNVGGARSFLWRNGVMRAIGLLPGLFEMHALSVNRYGDVVGRATFGDGMTTRAFLWTAARGVRDLDLPSGATSASAMAITDKGMIVGFDNRFRAWRRFVGGSGASRFRLLERLPRTTVALALGATALGPIVGRNGDQAFLWLGGVVSALPRLAGGAWALAVAVAPGYAVGSSATRAGQTHAVVWYLP